MAKQYRTVDLALLGEYEGWTAKMRAEGISARIFIELSSSDVGRQMTALASLVVSHNFKDTDGTVVPDILDAPIDALGELISKWGDAVAALPPR
jgi:hypothetical protein